MQTEIERSIVEGTRLIAEFMGWQITDSEVYRGYYNPPKEIRSFIQPMDLRSMKYHSSWDWLMPACKKWNELIIDDRQHLHLCFKLQEAFKDFEIMAVYAQLVKNIQWYNNQKQ